MQIDDKDLNYQKEKLLDDFSNKLLSNGATELESEEIHIWICYPKKEIEDFIDDSNKSNAIPKPLYKSEVFLFNKINDKCGQVMSRHKDKDISQIVKKNLMFININ